ncbi:putative quinol monooxygenase [Leifsonia sp. 2MCAF36]
MLIVAGYLQLAPSDRDRFVHAHADLVKRGRQAPGCLDLAISADPVDVGRVNNFELWESQQALDDWRAIAAPPELGMRFLGGDMQMYHISHSSSPFSTVGRSHRP